MSSLEDAQPDRDDGWMAQAACRVAPPRWFTDPDGPHDIRSAVATCSRCPVRQPCLSTALAQPAAVDVGIWGGTTEDDRKLLRKGRTPPARLPAHDDAVPEQSRTHPPNPPPAVRRLPTPELAVARDACGDFTDTTGRVMIFRIHGEPPWMLMIDKRCIARTDTLAGARHIAWTQLHAPDRPRATHAAPAATVRQTNSCHKPPASVRTPSATQPPGRGRTR